jgi:predicted nucleotidyltransferase
LLEAKLFGSTATGKDQPDPDIDVLVVVNRNGEETEHRVLDIGEKGDRLTGFVCGNGDRLVFGCGSRDEAENFQLGNEER